MLIARCQQDIGWLEIAVNDALRVRVVNGPRQRGDQFCGHLRFERSFGDGFCQVGTLYQLIEK